MDKVAKVCLGVLVTGLLFGLTSVAGRAAQPSPKPAEGQLTLASLKTVLDGLAYDEVKENKNDKGEVKSYSVKILRGTWTFWVNLSFSSDGKSAIWFNSWLAKVPDPANVPSKALLGLLEANNSVWPTYFWYSPRWTQFCLSSSLLNKGLTAKAIRARIEKHCQVVQDNVSLWNPTKWPGAKPKKPTE